MKRSKEEAAETIRKLMEVARSHFAEHGYAEAALESIVQEAGLTRGAVYHHFRSKKDLFRAVLADVQQDVAERVESEAATSEEMGEQLYLGCRAFILAAIEDRNRRILLIDGPAIVGWEAWREMDRHHSMRLLREQLGLMQEHGYVRPMPLDALVHFISGGLNETALWLAGASVEPDAQEETMKMLAFLLDGLKKQS
ncbi:TetR/AcrR family transcriptional regulator [Paenibacillus pasadenensis]|uniref:TetR/AcrR family transcriptional regulator n=1 Tax=Paenibacillus TaxID=44249 RepID=UPI0004073C7F|nr:TetR/AcrR family transcriptional regulator [Paenibacillus pasadenensis]